MVKKSRKALLVNWIVDRQVENLLEERGIPFEIISIKANEIDWEVSEENPGRGGETLTSDQRESLAVAMKNGNAIPMIAVTDSSRKENRPYSVWSGRTRQNTAADVGCTSFKVMYVKYDDFPSDGEFLLMCAAANASHGSGLSKSDKINQAIEAITEFGVDIKYAALTLSISVESIRQRMNGLEVKRLAAEEGFDGRLSNSQWYSLYGLRDNVNVLTAVAKYVQQYKPSDTSVRALIKKIKKQRTEASKLKVVELEEEDIPVKGKPASRKIQKQRNNKQDRLFSVLDTVYDLVQGKSARHFQLKKKTKAYEKAQTKTKDVINELNQLFVRK